MYIKDMAAVVAAGATQYASLLQLLKDLEIEKLHPAHKSFLLALIRSGKVNVDNLSKVQLELRLYGHQIDSECIYCKYSQFALKESAKVGLV